MRYLKVICLRIRLWVMLLRGWIFVNSLVVVWCLLGLSGGAGAAASDYRTVCGELHQAGFMILGSGTAYGVPFVEIRIPLGASVTPICQCVPSFNKDFHRCRRKIAFFNALNPSYVRTIEPQPSSLETDTLKIPLDRDIDPEIFPPHNDSLEAYADFLLVDIGKGFLALYSQGELQRVYPISGGREEKQTPLISFTVQAKDENHWSTIYDTYMPWSLLVKRPYYIHGGALPGQRDSAGCIRLFPQDAEELYHLVAVGTPGRIVQTSALAQISPAFFGP
jgi:hypothetical protein